MKPSRSESLLLRMLTQAAAALMLSFGAIAALPYPASANVSGAVYTSDATASKVNQNLYDNKDDVYLSGGPKPPSCSSGGLSPSPADYYFQVTDPSGSTLLSTDSLNCRKVHVENGEVTSYIGGCGHAIGIPVSLCPGSTKITVQLSPYNDTPNNGGVYKMWMTPVDQLAPGCDPTTTGATCDGNFGFVHGEVKTDNFRVKNSVNPPELESQLNIFKFCDANANGVLDPDELMLGLDGWSVSATGATPCSGVTGADGEGLKICSQLDPGAYNVAEILQAGFTHSATCHDGFCGTCTVASSTSCNFDTDCPVGDTCSLFGGVNSLPVTLVGGQTTEVDFGNIDKGSISGSKFSDNNANGVNNSEPPIAGLKVVLTGTQDDGTLVSKCTTTDANGNYSFGSLLSGTYTATEMPPANVIATTPTSCQHSLTLDETCVVSDFQCAPFGNTCQGAGGGLTLGFWSNKNGQKLEVASDFTALSALNLVNADGSAHDFTGTLAQNKTNLNSWILGANAANMAYMLSAQLTAMKLNVLHGKVNGAALVFAGQAPAGCTIPGLSALGFISVNYLMNDANAELAPPGNVTKAGNPERACQEFKKNALDNANNNKNFVVPCPQSFGQTCPPQG